MTAPTPAARAAAARAWWARERAERPGPVLRAPGVCFGCGATAGARCALACPFRPHGPLAPWAGEPDPTGGPA